MAAGRFSEISIRAAAITGAVLGFLCWLLVMPYGALSGGAHYGIMGYMMGYYGGTATYPSAAIGGIWALSVLFGAIGGAIAGAVLAVVYNWALKLKL
ncbi:MAG: hypothetical protein KGH58_04470 [Candidatus Micrarchaeota archaeon]|nr:hypothetical protein [Candidatus Micrarchaeota archaeon]